MRLNNNAHRFRLITGRKRILTGLVFYLCASCNSYASDEQIAQELRAAVETLKNATAQLQSQNESMAELRTEIANLKANQQTAIPPDAVVAFDTSNGCPVGWTPFKDGQSRVILGASFGIPDSLFPGDERRDYKYRDHGGKREVALSPNNLATHNHRVGRVSLWFQKEQARIERFGTQPNGVNIPWYLKGTSRDDVVEPDDTFITDAGKSTPHENMPPFLALYYCKKD